MTTGKRYAGFDYPFRPTSYWRMEDDVLAEHLKNVKGTNRRRMIRDYSRAGRIEELDPKLRAEVLRDDTREWLGALHPSFLGGEFLPDYLAAEVEIARIELESTTADVISVRARRGTGATARIRYRIVDEYETEFTWAPKSSKLPLDLGQLVDLIDRAAPCDCPEWVWDGLGIGYNQSIYDEAGDAPSLRHFTTVSSEFYPQLEAHYDRVHEGWVAEKVAEGKEDEESTEEEEDPLSDPKHAEQVAELLMRAEAQLPEAHSGLEGLGRMQRLSAFKEYLRNKLRRTGALPTGERDIEEFGRFKFSE